LVNNNAFAYALDADTGKVLWERRIGRLNASSPAYYKHRLYIVNLEPGHLVKLDAWLDRYCVGLADDAAAADGSSQPSDPVRAYDVQFEPLAAEQALWIETRDGLAIGERIRTTLSLGPEPHPYRRIRRLDDGMQLAVKEWRVRFVVAGRDVRVTRLDSGFRASQLAAAGAEESLRLHLEFLAKWPRALG
jgi:hypothetical protein